MTTFKLGKNKTTGKIVTIAEVNRGLTCDCICPNCGKVFVAAQGDKNDWHFRHYEETDCNGGQETALHLLAKEIIANNSEITLPFHGLILYDNAIKEKYFQTIQPDVTASTNGKNLFFEVLVTHRVDLAKEKFYVDGGHKSIEIDLQNFTFTSKEDLTKEILTNCKNKRIIFWEKKVVVEESSDYSWIVWIVFGIIAFFRLKSLSQKRR